MTRPRTIIAGPYKAGAAHYADELDDVVGMTFGPTTYGRAVIAVAQEYDVALDRTTVTFNFVGEAVR